MRDQEESYRADTDDTRNSSEYELLHRNSVEFPEKEYVVKNKERHVISFLFLIDGLFQGNLALRKKQTNLLFRNLRYVMIFKKSNETHDKARTRMRLNKKKHASLNLPNHYARPSHEETDVCD